MTRMVLALVFVILASYAQIGAVVADVLLIEEVRQAGQMNVPDNGLTMADVQSKFGEPVKKYAAVGDPPITRWEYQAWSVYFENDVVLFTVLHKDKVNGKKTE